MYDKAQGQGHYKKQVCMSPLLVIPLTSSLTEHKRPAMFQCLKIKSSLQEMVDTSQEPKDACTIFVIKKLATILFIRSCNL
jgi:hypothetical protein